MKILRRLRWFRDHYWSNAAPWRYWPIWRALCAVGWHIAWNGYYHWDREGEKRWHCHHCDYTTDERHEPGYVWPVVER